VTFIVRTDRRYIRPHDRSERFILAEIEAPAAPVDPHRRRPPVNLAFVLDRSGSMGGQKIELARRAVEEAIGRLHDDDRFAVVVYDDVIDVVVESTRASREARHNALDRLRAIDARGSTNLAEGWLRGSEQIATNLSADGVNRVLLLTDGLANVGITDRDELARHAGELRARGVTTSTFGVGDDFDEALLEAMATAGGGHFYYVEHAQQIPDHITSEVGETLEVVAREVTIELTAPEAVHVEAISPHAATTRGNRTTVSVGDLVSSQAVEVVLRLTFPYGELGRDTGAIVALLDREGVFAQHGSSPAEPVRLGWTYADDATNDRQTRDRAVDRAVARQFAARARKQAVGLNRRGAFEPARQLLDDTARRIRRYAGTDTDLRALVGQLEVDAQAYRVAMPERSRKMAFYASANVAHSRDTLGKAIRRS
jgi:Ca-activated chloride channel family protein